MIEVIGGFPIPNDPNAGLTFIVKGKQVMMLATNHKMT
jgi:hypothetical protein